MNIAYKMIPMAALKPLGKTPAKRVPAQVPKIQPA